MFKLADLQQDAAIDDVSCEDIGTKDDQAIGSIGGKEFIDHHSNERAPNKEDGTEIQVFEGQPLQLLERNSSDIMEVEDDANSRTQGRTEEEFDNNILVA